MDPRLLKYYNQELQYIRDMGGEFAREYPKIAARLSLDGFECTDPYVERLLEGFAFLAARVQLKLDAEFPHFTQHLLEMVYPHYLAPTPSMAVVQFQPDPGEGSLADGFTLPHQSVLRSVLGRNEQTPCEYRTAQEVTLWPLELARAEYFTGTGPVAGGILPDPRRIKSGLRLRLRATAGLTFDKIALDRLPLHLRGTDEVPTHLLEQILAHTTAVVVQSAANPAPWGELLPAGSVGQPGFGDAEALLPHGPQSFQGYRLLAEYFAFPSRFMFVELTGLGMALRRCTEAEVDVILLFDRPDPVLENRVGTDQFALFCSPVVNLFPKRCDRIHLGDHVPDHHVVPDRTRPMDFEIHTVTGVEGYGVGSSNRQDFMPFYALGEPSLGNRNRSYYTVRRVPRTLSEQQHRAGTRSSYVGHELYLALVDADEAPYRGDLRQLAVSALCTNRDLPLHLRMGLGATDFTLESGAPVKAVRCMAGPTRPRPTTAEGEMAWRLISHLSLNYLSLADSDPEQGAAALRELLGLYGSTHTAHIHKQVEGVKSIAAVPVVRRLPAAGPITFGRGLEVTVTFDEGAFEGASVFLLGAVLEQFFAKYVSINSFSETVIRTLDRGEVMRWPPRIGRRQQI